MLDMRIKYVNLPGIPCGAGAVSSRQWQVYAGPNTIYFGNLFCTIAGVAATDAQVDAQIASVEVRDDEQVLVDWFTPAELRAVYNHFHAKDTAWAANTGDIPLLHVPDNFPWRGQGAFYGLGRRADNGKDTSQYKITVLFTAGPVTIDSIVPTLTVDATETNVKLGRHLRFNRYQAQAFAGTGDNPLTDLFRNMKPVACHELWFNSAVGTVADFTVVRDNEWIHNHTPATAIARQMHRAGFTAVAGRTILGFNENNDPTSVLPLVGSPSVTITPNWSVTPGGAYDVLRVLEYDGHSAS